MRLLDVSEIIAVGDEWFDERDESWNPTTHASWGRKVTLNFIVRRSSNNTFVEGAIPGSEQMHKDEFRRAWG